MPCLRVTVLQVLIIVVVCSVSLMQVVDYCNSVNHDDGWCCIQSLTSAHVEFILVTESSST